MHIMQYAATKCIKCITYLERNLSKMHHIETSRIVSQAIKTFGQGTRGLAAYLGKDPSLVSRYASGVVRPKAETLIKCIGLLDASDDQQEGAVSEQPHMDLAALQMLTENLSAIHDKDLIKTLLGIFRLAGKYEQAD